MTAAIPEWLRVATNGTTSYLALFLAFIFFGGLLLIKGHPAGRYNLAAALVFVVSLGCRIVDQKVCGGFPLGTHFLWHLLNGRMLAFLLASVARYGAPTRPREDLPLRTAPASH